METKTIHTVYKRRDGSLVYWEVTLETEDTAPVLDYSKFNKPGYRK